MLFTKTYPKKTCFALSTVGFYLLNQFLDEETSETEGIRGIDSRGTLVGDKMVQVQNVNGSRRKKAKPVAALDLAYFVVQNNQNVIIYT